MKPLLIGVSLLVFGLGTIEGFARWWMHPGPAGLGEPVLVYRPGSETRLDRPAADDAESSQPSSSITTPLPEIVAKAMPSLRCSTGTAARIEEVDGTTVNLAFFEWNLADSTNVLEAFKHLPDECMGSIGMKLTAHLPVRNYQVDDQDLGFDHSVFRDPSGSIVHTFKATWVSGSSSLLDKGFRGGVDQWNQIRWKAGLKRFHPAYACVAQGAVRGIPNPDLAWLAFENAMLKDLHMALPNQ